MISETRSIGYELENCTKNAPNFSTRIMPYFLTRKGKKGTGYRLMVRLKNFPPQSATFDTRADALIRAQEVEHALLRVHYIFI